MTETEGNNIDVKILFFGAARDAVGAEEANFAVAAGEWLIRELKGSVPIWKKEFYAGGAAWADGENVIGAE